MLLDIRRQKLGKSGSKFRHGGGGYQKWPKKCRRLLWTAPYDKTKHVVKVSGEIVTGTFCSELCSSLLLMYYFSSNLVPAQIYSNLMGTIFFCFISYPSQRLLILLFFTILADEIQQMQMGHHLFLPRILRLLVLLDPRILRPRALFYRTECTCRSKFLTYTLKYKHFYLSLIFDYILMFYLY